MRKINLNISGKQTEIITGNNLLHILHEMETLKKLNCSKFILLSDSSVFDLYGKKTLNNLKKIKNKVVSITINPGESRKTFMEINRIIQLIVNNGVDRNAVLVCLGGGVITDIGGFIASILLRGIKLINIPTTLTGQIDASIGGKNGVNLIVDNVMAKNILGTFKQPDAVISDIDVLQSLPEKDVLNGLAEMAKYWVGWGKPSINEILKIKNQKDSKTLENIIFMCQMIKMDIVSKDPLETLGIRKFLNLGHTIGHAIEAAAKGKINHGEAVSLGLVAVSKISQKLNLLKKEISLQIINNLKLLGLPVIINGVKLNNVIQALTHDKKAGEFILIKNIGEMVCRKNIEKNLIMKVLREILV